MRIYDIISDLTKTIGRLRAILDIYPDVQIHKDAFGRLLPHSKSVNSKAKFFSLSQGTSAGKPTTMLAWTEFDWRGEKVRVFAEIDGSPILKIGEINNDGFDVLSFDIESTFLKNNMSGLAIDYVRTHAEEIEKEFNEYMKAEEENRMLEDLQQEEWFEKLNKAYDAYKSNITSTEDDDQDDDQGEIYKGE